MLKLDRDFYQRETEQVARDLLGKILVRRLGPAISLAGRIVETEAYTGIEDPASHSFALRYTERNAVMYEPGGVAYIYQIYGLHHCLNTVTHIHQPEAVLIRAIEPLEGIQQMARWRGVEAPHLLCSGPGKICQAFGLDRTHNGLDLCQGELFVLDAPTPAVITAGPRIGVDYAGEAAFWPLRFGLPGHKCLSKPFR